MSHPLLHQLQARVRMRRIAISLAQTLPLVIALAFVLHGRAGPLVAAGAILFVLGIIAALIVRDIRRVTAGAIVRGLDHGAAVLEDSSDLLLEDADAGATLQRLQRARIVAKLDSSAIPDLRPAWPWRRLVLSWLAGFTMVAAAWYWPAPAPQGDEPAVAAPQQATTAATTRLVSAEMEIEPPVYTGLAVRRESRLEAEVAEGSRLHWKLGFDPLPKAAALKFLDGTELPLVEEGGYWSAQSTLGASTLYRIAVESAAPLQEDRLLRLDAIADRAPEIRVVEPERTLSLLDAGQKAWSLDFEVSDDYGVGAARLAITLAQGSGEQVTVSERSLRLPAQEGGDARHRRFRHRIALDSLAFAAGDDLIVRLSVEDNRPGRANVARSASYILRWPPETSAQGDGVEGVVQKVLPAYFRSQRQIIIDTEALLAEQPRPAADRFLARSDSIGVDQKILRLRYGQFLGEEFESGGSARPHADDEGGHDSDTATQQDALSAGHGHDEATANGKAAFGRADEVLAEYGHTHDHAEAATLLDPETKKILRAALSEMWQAELHLRLGEPGKALPFENRALAYIKQVQQSTRIYLARVGLELPPVDESRRLSGERAGLRDPGGVLAPASVEDGNVTAVYQSLQANAGTDLDAFERWLREHTNEVPDALGLIAATDALRRAPDCEACRRQLLDRLWAVLPAPPAASVLRPAADAGGRTYLQRLDTDTAP
jgi:hypothetical protein